MDFHGIEALLGLPAFCVIGQVRGPQQLALHLERRDTSIVCPRCQTCCSQVKESRPRCIRDLPLLELPVVLWLHIRRFACPNGDCRHRPWETSETFGEHVKWTERLTATCDRNTWEDARAKNSPVALVSLSAPCFAGPLRGVGVAAHARLAEPLALMRIPGARGIVRTH